MHGVILKKMSDLFLVSTLCVNPLCDYTKDTTVQLSGIKNKGTQKNWIVQTFCFQSVI